MFWPPAALISLVTVPMYQTIPQRPEGDWPEDGLETLGACPVCESTQRTVLHDGLRDNVFFCAPGKWTMWRCEGCRSAYLDPRPTPETIHLAYTKYYTHEPLMAPEADEQLSVPRKIRRSLANGYRNWRYGTEHRPASPLGIPVALALPPLRRLIDLPFRYLPHPAVTGGRRLLDVGFGSGDYLDYAASVGWEAFGCDPDSVAIENARARGLNVRHGGIEVWDDEEATFDAVTLSHVIEHVHNPSSVLAAVHRLLRPGGQLYVETPNIDALGHEKFGRSWRGLEPPRHLRLFNWRSLQLVLSRVGFVRTTQRINPNVIEPLGRLSASLDLNLDPYSLEAQGIRGSDFWLRLASRCSRQRSEFITLTCRKPT